VRIPLHILDLIVEDIDNYYIFTKRFTIVKGDEWINKGSIAHHAKNPPNGHPKGRLLCFGRTKNYNDGSLPIYDFIHFRDYIRPLSKDEKYEILFKYSQKMSSKIKRIKKQIEGINL
jgi:hypothetical protein